ncbi:MAG: nucleoside monophosphate kinase [Elusimicrobiota bacterium]|nr:nucleoside monophosphate kinase [Elusimicrobiota bacterium]
MIVILLGSPGSGKGTQSKRLAEKYGFNHLATGDIFRAEIAQKTTIGEKAADYLKKGKLVPDAVVIEMVAGKIDKGGNYLLDGFPRTLEQAQGLTDMLKSVGAGVDLVAFLTLPKEEAIRRMASRRTCTNCGEVYNTISRPTKAEGVCDKCGAQVVQREDDSEATAAKRLMVFEDLTHPLVAYYKSEAAFQEVDASKAPEKVEAALSAVIDSTQGPK